MTFHPAGTCQKVFPSFMPVKRQLETRELPLQPGPRVFYSLHEQGLPAMNISVQQE